MKKYIFIIISLIISIFSAWSVWEGNGIAGTATDFTEDGMFVKSSLFPKYTLIEIVNLENDMKVRAIVLEGKEVPGILMSFSPSVAEALKVQYGEVTRIRISSPSLTSDDIAAPLYLPKEETSKEESKKDILAMSEKKAEEPKKIEEPKKVEAEKPDNEKEVVLYDFNPIAKTPERIERKDGAISFDPAFIEEDVKLDLHIPNTPVVPKKESVPEKKEEKPIVKQEVVAVKEVVTPSKAEPIVVSPRIVDTPIKTEPVVITPKTVDTPIKTEPVVITPKTVDTPIKTESVVIIPKTVATPLKPIYLENTSLRPPREVPPITVVEEKSKKDVPVKDVVMIEKKKAEEPRLFIKVDEVEPIREANNEKVEVAPSKVNEVNAIKENTSKKEEKIEKVECVLEIQNPEKEVQAKLPLPKEVKEASQIKEPVVEEKKVEIAKVGEVEVPQYVEEEKDVILPTVIELPQVVHAPDEEEENVLPVTIVNTPQKTEEEKEAKTEEVPIVESIIPVQETPQKEEEAKVEEPIEKEVVTEETVEEAVEEAPVVEEDETEVEPEPEVEQTVEEETTTEEEVAPEEEPKIEEIVEKEIEQESTIEPITKEAIEEKATEEELVSKKDTIDQSATEEVLLKLPTKEAEITEDALKEVKFVEGQTAEAEEVLETKELDETPLREIAVKNVKNNIEEEPSKDSLIFQKGKDTKTLDENTIPEKFQEKPLEKEEKQEIQEERKDVIEEAEVKTKKQESIEEFKSIEMEVIAEETHPIEEAKPVEMEIIQKDNIKLPLNTEKKEESVAKPVTSVKEDAKTKIKESFSTGKTMKNASYVQVAVFTNALAVEDVLMKYSKQYPIIVEKKETSSGVRYVVLVGPLKKDELGAIQERFKSFGFKDSFLK